jgi:flavin-dependent dehydrogenase
MGKAQCYRVFRKTSNLYDRPFQNGVMNIMEYEAIVLGAGPAGSAVAKLLAEWGHSVLMIDRPSAQRRGLAISIPPSTQRTFAALGMLDAVEAAGFHEWRGNTVWWSEQEPRVERFPDNARGHHVLRASLSDVLRPLAVDAGAHLREGHVRDVRFAEDSPVTVTIESGEHDWQARARLALDCTGRSGIIARHGLRQLETSHRTVALVGEWRSEGGWKDVDDTHTLVAAYEDGWAWSIPTGDGVRYFTVMVDPERTQLTRGQSSDAVYLAELAKPDALRSLLERGRLAEGPWGHDATLYSAHRYAGPAFLLVGDAASFIDPLSSFGVKKALASAWVSAIVTHTALVRPGMRDEALAFHERRERAVYFSYRAQSASFAATAGQSHHPFWAARSSSFEEVAADTDLDAASLSHDPEVARAFDELRRRPEIRLGEGSSLRFTSRAMIRGREIVLDDHLALPECPDGIRYLRGVDLVELARLAPHHTDVGDFYGSVLRQQPAVGLPDFLAALSWLISRNVLRHEP